MTTFSNLLFCESHTVGKASSSTSESGHGKRMGNGHCRGAAAVLAPSVALWASSEMAWSCIMLTEYSSMEMDRSALMVSFTELQLCEKEQGKKLT